MLSIRYLVQQNYSIDLLCGTEHNIQVPNPSAANDEGITALHNSVCAGYFDVVR